MRKAKLTQTRKSTFWFLATSVTGILPCDMEIPPPSVKAGIILFIDLQCNACYIQQAALIFHHCSRLNLVVSDLSYVGASSEVKDSLIPSPPCNCNCVLAIRSLPAVVSKTAPTSAVERLAPKQPFITARRNPLKQATTRRVPNHTGNLPVRTNPLMIGNNRRKPLTHSVPSPAGHPEPPSA